MSTIVNSLTEQWCNFVLVQVTSHRARKGFMLKLNPDTHWSNVLYRSLNVLQLSDGSNILFVNRDDASGFCLDMLTTHHQFPNPVVKGKETLTTYTDYVKIVTHQCYRLPTTISLQLEQPLNYVQGLLRPNHSSLNALPSMLQT